MQSPTQIDAQQICNTIGVEAAHELNEAMNRIEHCLRQLTDDQIWWRPSESQNSIANLILHLCGNLRQWLHSGLTGAEDHRNRPAEFAQRQAIPTADLLALLRQTVAETTISVSNISPAEMLRVRRIQGFDQTALGAIFHSVPHFRGHTQEIIYRTRCFLGDKYQFAWTPSTPEQGAPKRYNHPHDKKPTHATQGDRDMLNLDFTGRHVVVTGGTGALGAAVVQILVDAGAVCHIPAHRQPDGPPRERVHIESKIDLTDETAVSGFYQSLPSLWASVHTAGGFVAGSIGDTSLQMWKQMHDSNAVTCFLCCREAIRKIRATGGGGRIVNVAAKPALIPAAGLSAYAASKAAVSSLTVGLSEELAAEKIWVNAVVPSIMDTPINRQVMPNADHDKWPSLSDVAATIAFLASPENQATRGALVPVYGRS